MTCLGDGWEETLLLQSSPPETSSKKLASCVPFMRSYAADLVNALKNDMAELLNQALTFPQQIHAKQLGVAVFFHSTASIRDYQDWFVDGFFTLFRQELNAWKDHDRYHFFSNPDMTRPISGAEEGLFSFLALNFVTGGGRLNPDVPPPGGKDASQQLASVIEVGGASSQIVSPVPSYPLQPPFIKQFSLAQETGLTQWPRLDVISVSFLQLGVASAGGLLLKNTCANPEFLSDGICSNPCYPQGFEQAQCSSGRASISRETGRVTVNDNPRESRLNTSAMFCSRYNSAISFKPLNEMSCRAYGLDPDLPLKERVAFPKCRMIVGTGDFQKCRAEVERVLLAPKLPIPGNMEASGVGFDNVEQLFRLVSSSSPVHFIGDALVNALNDLHDFGYFGTTPILNEKGEVQNNGATYQALRQAAEDYCKSSVDFIDGQGLVLRTPKDKNNNEKRRLDGFNITTCQDIALLYGFLTHMQSAEMKPEKFIFKTKFHDEKNPQHINNGMEYGWHLGAILYRVLKKDSWSKIAYESGVGFNLPAARRL
ncbi:gda1 cd39 (nucleoside phosphatase) family protein [Cystoisospora suis]|uniref:Gda1 cd39 (Nucleoside phosphatase) family protein n=1 Tax=Cystoisospora suis TaxID=483139 RepID=A0A2C6L7R0_9APIC|nr:gda1 cd39 (nucleoside phosphatase) family protein [Cystoisospora suis]